jgi:ATP-dependent Clp protease protease subunit
MEVSFNMIGQHDVRISLTFSEEVQRDLLHRGILVFNEDIDANSLDLFQQHFLYVTQKLGLLRVTVLLTTNGGALDCALGLYDLIAGTPEPCQVDVVANGYCYSAGVIVLQAGKRRLITPNTVLMIHECSTVQFGKMTEVEEDVKFIKRLEHRVNEILTKRSKLSLSALSKRIKGKNWWLMPEEALKWQLVDDIVSLSDILRL